MAIRLLHMGPELDDPHMWRQSDTAFYIYDFYQNGVDLLHPSVCWMGEHRTVVLEFPLPEAMVAWMWRLLGPDLFWARLLFLGSFVVAAIYLFKVLRHLIGAEFAAFSTLVFLALPLGLYYSRAVHFDFMVVAMGHAMLYHFMVALDRKSWAQMGIAATCAALGFMIKAPTIFFLALPGAYYVHRSGKWREMVRFLPMLMIPVVAMLGWTWHSKQVNAAMPDWAFIPEYHKMDNMWGWYFGTWQARMEWPLWQQIWGRVKFELAAVVGVPLGIIGGLMMLLWRRYRPLLWWVVGAVAYVLIFFTLNFHHNYYQIPLVAPTAFLIALPLYHLYEWLCARNVVVAKWLSLGLFWVIALNAIRLSEGKGLSESEKTYFGTYYQPEPLQQGAGRLIGAHTPENAVVLSTFGGLDPRCPIVLYHARRVGWSVGKQFISIPIIEGVRKLGATHFALFQVEPMSPELEAYVQQFPMERHVLAGTHWPLRLWSLRDTTPQLD